MLLIHMHIYLSVDILLILVTSVGVMITDQAKIKPQSTATQWL